GGIFTATTTSLSSSLRQRSTRYTIRAGRNLPDKEFRYLRTVIVTADIHGDFGSTLRPAFAGLTSYHNLSALVTCHTLYVVFTTWQSAVFLVNSRLTHFTATRCILATHSCFSITREIASLGRFVRLRQTNHLAKSPKCSGHPFFRSYGARLPSSL